MKYSFDDRMMGFTHNPLDRISDKRDDADFMGFLFARPDAQVLVIARDMPVLSANDVLFPVAVVPELGDVSEQAFLGLWDGIPIFAVLLAEEASEILEVADEGGLLDTRVIQLKSRKDLALRDTRSLAANQEVPAEMLGILAQAKAVLHWNATHRFCGRCGGRTAQAASGWRRDCPHCHAQHFPRTDPVVIMLAVDGERCLLGRQPRFPRGMYSCLAGFLESGETLEDAVRRELFEEAGIRVGKVQYLGSQPWPFPASLMMGAIAQATTIELKVDTTELEDARWFSRAEAQQLLDGTHPDGLNSPVRMAIAHHILKAWLEGETTV